VTCAKHPGLLAQRFAILASRNTGYGLVAALADPTESRPGHSFLLSIQACYIPALMKAFGTIFLVWILMPWQPATAAGKYPSDQRLVIGRLPCTHPTNSRDHGIRQLAWDLVKRTSVEAEMDPVEVDLASQELFRTPFLVWSCEGPVAALDEKAYANLRRFLTLGGFLLIDDPSASPGGTFDLSVRLALEKLLPGKKLKEIQGAHVLFKTFFLITQPAGRLLSASIKGISIGERLAVIYSANDLLGALSKDLYGNWEHVCEPGGEQQREISFRLSINIVFYAICLDYKNDSVHLPFILRRRRL